MKTMKTVRARRIPWGRKAFLACGLWLGVVMAFPGWASTVGVVNINTASASELQLLPGVGAQRAAAIVAVRTKRGGFRRPEDLIEVEGIGQVLLERMRPHLVIKGSTTARRVRPKTPAAGPPD